MIVNVNQVWRLRATGAHVLVRGFNHNTTLVEVSPCDADGNGPKETLDVDVRGFGGKKPNYDFVKRLGGAT